MRNEILEEIWRVRNAFAKRCHYDLRCMMEELRRVRRDPKNPLVHAERKPRGKRAKPPREKV
jgi:hypothetical protein